MKITVTCEDKSAVTNVLLVVKKKITKLELTKKPRIEYVEGQKLELGGSEIQFTYDDNTRETVSYPDFAAFGITASPKNETILKVADHNGKPVAFAYEGQEVTSDNLVVKPKTLEKIEVIPPTKLEYVSGQNLDLSGMKVTLTYNDGSKKEEIELSKFAENQITTSPVNGSKLSVADDHGKTLRVACEGKSEEVGILNVAEKAIEQVTIKEQPYSLHYVEGQALSLEGTIVTLSYNDGSRVDVSYAKFAENGIETSLSNGTVLNTDHNGKQIVLRTSNGKITKTTALSVEKKKVESMSVKEEPKLSYVEGQKLNLTGTVAVLHYNDGTEREIGSVNFGANGITTMPEKDTVLTVAEHNSREIVLTYQDEVSGSIHAEIPGLSVIAKAVKTARITSQPVKLSYVEGQLLDLTGTVVKLEYNDGSVEEIPASEFTQRGFTSTPAHGTPLTIAEHNEKGVQINGAGKSVGITENLEVKAKEVDGLTVKTQPTKLSYVEGQRLELSGSVVVLHYNDGSSEEVEAGKLAEREITAEPANQTTLSIEAHNGKGITFHCNGQRATSHVLRVTSKAVTGMAVKTQPTKTGYVAGEKLNLAGAIITITYNDGSIEEVGYEEFGKKGIEATPENGTILSVEAHNGRGVELRYQGEKVSTERLTVAAKEVIKVAIKAQPTRLSYIAGQKLNLSGSVVTLTYNDGSSKEVGFTDFGDYQISVSPANQTMLNAEEHNGKEIIISCNGKSAATNALTVAAKAVTEITMKTQPTRLSYVEGQGLDLSGTVVLLTYNDGTRKEVEASNFAENGITASPSNETALNVKNHNGKGITLSWERKSITTKELQVVAKAVSQITVKVQPKLSYVAGQKLDLSGSVVTLTYNDGSSKDVGFAQFAENQISVSPSNESVLKIMDNGKEITLTCNGISGKSEKLAVAARAVTKLEVKSQPTKLSYVEGQKLNLSGTAVILTYNDGSIEEVGAAQFEAKGITASPSNETTLNVKNHNGKGISLSCGNQKVETEKLNVVAKTVSKIAVKTQPSQLSYVEGQKLNLSGAIVILTYNDGETQEVEAARFAAKGISASPSEGTPLTVKEHNEKAVTLTCRGMRAETKKLEVAAKSLTGIAVTTAPKKTVYVEGEGFDKTGMVVTASYSDKTTKVVNSYKVSPERALTAADEKVVITYQEGSVTKTAEQRIKVNKWSVSYQTHVQNIGWQEYVKDGALSGTSGQSLRLEGIRIQLEKGNLEGGIQYRTQVQNIGWQEYVKDGEMAGSSGQSLRLEGIQIQLTGEAAEKYDIYYRTHIQDYGWLGWAKNGEKSGSAGLSKRLEGIEIVLVAKGGEAPGSTENVYQVPTPAPVKASVQYQTYIQNIGWQEEKRDGQLSGTTGQGLRLEGIQIKLNQTGISGGIQYRTHVQNIGWGEYVENGAFSGSKGQGLRMEALQIRLSGELAEKYDVYYRTHIQDYGWLGWGKNGEESGSAGLGKRIESIELCLVAKGGAVPGTTEQPFVK